MKRIIKILVFSVFLFFLVASCQNKDGNKKVEPVNTDQLAKEINKNLPERSTEKVLPGKAVFAQHCLTCHQADGSGVPNMHPPLGPGSWIEKEPAELVAIMMKGLSGKIEVNGEEYKNFMPSHANLTDQEIADVLTYVRSSFGNNLGPVTPELVAKIRSGR
jgi:mono/diheme cytochrome c family protein